MKNFKILFLSIFLVSAFTIKVNAQSTTAGNDYNSNYFLGWGSSNNYDLPFKIDGSTKAVLNTNGYWGVGLTNSF